MKGPSSWTAMRRNTEIHCDSRNYMLCIGLRVSASVESEEIAPSVVVDYDKDNKVIGIGIADGSKYADTSRLAVQRFTDAVIDSPRSV